MDGGNLVWMGRGPASKAMAARAATIVLERCRVAEICVERVDGSNPRRGRGREAERARQPIGVGPAPALLLVARRPDRGGKILGAPGERREAGMRRGDRKSTRLNSSH